MLSNSSGKMFKKNKQVDYNVVLSNKNYIETKIYKRYSCKQSDYNNILVINRDRQIKVHICHRHSYASNKST